MMATKNGRGRLDRGDATVRGGIHEDRAMAEDPTMMRHFNLIRVLGARRLGVTVRELSRELGVVERTVRRDLGFLKRMGVPVEARAGDHGRKTWKLGEAWSRPPLEFNFEEAAALYLGRQLMESMAGTPFWAAASRAWRKIRSTLGETATNYLDTLSRMLYCTEPGHGDYSSQAAILESLTIAIEEYKATHITYRSERATEPATRDVYPLRLVRLGNGALYLLAVDPQQDDVRTYKVDRIEAAEVSELIFERFRDFDVAAYLERSLGIYDGDDDVGVVIRFLPAAARHARETRWHKSESFSPQRDGSLILRLHLSSTIEIRSRVLSYGATAVVLEPESLRAEIAAELERMLGAYAAQPAGPTGRDPSPAGPDERSGRAG
jgi:predicted DNA-binding transcriptional regulator YafY